MYTFPPCHANNVMCVHLGYEQTVGAGAKTLLPASASPAKQGLIKTCDWDKTSEATCDRQVEYR